VQLFQFFRRTSSFTNSKAGDHNECWPTRPMPVRKPRDAVELRPVQNDFYLRVTPAATVFVPLYFSTWPAAAEHWKSAAWPMAFVLSRCSCLLPTNCFSTWHCANAVISGYLNQNLNMRCSWAAFGWPACGMVAGGYQLQSVPSTSDVSALHVASQFSRHFPAHTGALPAHRLAAALQLSFWWCQR